MKRTSAANLLTDRLLALGEMVRLRILRILEREELSVGEVAKVIQLPQSTVSRHLKILSDGDWLTKRAEGTATLYRLILDELPPDSRNLWLTIRQQLSGHSGDGSTSELQQDLRRLISVIDERREDAQAFFGRVAGQWDELRREFFGERFTALSLLRLLPSTWTVADLGCGTGNLAEVLAPVVKKVHAIDQSPAMLAAAKKRLAHHPNVELIQGSLQAIPLKAASVDAAVCALVLHHIEGTAGIVAALSEMRRIIRSGGQTLIIDMLEHDRSDYRHMMEHKWLGFAKDSFSSMMHKAGFKDVHFDELPPDPQARGPGLFVCTGRVQ